MTTRLPVLLENLRIATPCLADWDQMAGDDRVRFCGRCEKNVYNLSAMSRQEAEALVAAKEARMCVRLYQRQDGTVITSDCPVGVRRKLLRQRVWAKLSGAAASLTLALGLFAGRARGDLALRDGKKVGQVEQHPIAMGGAVAVVEPPQPVKSKPAKPQPAKMGEPMPFMGDVSAD